MRKWRQAVGEGLGDEVVHKGQRGAAADEALVRPASEDLGEELLGGGNAAEEAVVAHFDAVGNAVGGIGEGGQQTGGQVELLQTGLAAGHVQRQALGLEGVVAGPDAGVFRLHLGFGHSLICGFLHGIVLLLILFEFPTAFGCKSGSRPHHAASCEKSDFQTGAAPGFHIFYRKMPPM